MRVYELANTELRGSVNLINYEEIIKQIIKDIAPQVKVTVEPDRYILDREISKGQAIRIGRKIAKSRLGRYCLQRSILFVGHTMPPQKQCKGANKYGNKHTGKSNNNTRK